MFPSNFVQVLEADEAEKQGNISVVSFSISNASEEFLKYFFRNMQAVCVLYHWCRVKL